jgi:hypothetical protein
MYRRALEFAPSVEARGEALRGVAATGELGAASVVEGFLRDPALGAQAAEAYIALSVGGVDRAERQLLEVAKGNFSRELRQRAAEELRAMGRDPQRTVRAQGFLLDWWLVGPLPNPERKGLETKYFPEEVIDLKNMQNIGARRFRWQRFEGLSLDGAIDLVPVFRRSDERVAYAYAQIDSAAARDVLLKLGSNDGVACWLNGERLHSNNASREWQADQDTVRAALREGKNELLVKIANDGGAWAFSVRVTDAEGKPLVLPVSSL